MKGYCHVMISNIVELHFGLNRFLWVGTSTMNKTNSRRNVLGVPNNILWNKRYYRIGTSCSILVTLSLWQSITLWDHYESLNKQETICVHALSGNFNLDNL